MIRLPERVPERNPLRTSKPLWWQQLWPVITCRPIELESWSNLLRIQQVFDLRSKKNFSAWVLGSLCVTSQWEHVWAILGQLCLTWAPMRKYFPQCFYGFLTRKRVFRALDWLVSVSGSKIMPQKPKTVNILLPKTLIWGEFHLWL